MKSAPLQLFEMQLKQGVLGVLSSADLPMTLKVWQCNGHENGHQGHTDEGFDQCKAWLKVRGRLLHAISMF